MTLAEVPLFTLAETPALRAALDELHDPDAGIVVCEMSVGHRREQQLADDMLTALGADLSRPGGARNENERWQRAIAWLAAYEPDDLVILGADRVSWKAWRDLAEAAAFVEARLWLVMKNDGPLPRLANDWLRKWYPWQHLGADGGRALLTALRPRPRRAEVRRSFPRVPAASFTLFRALAYEGLSPNEFELVDAVWSEALEQTRSWIGEQDEGDEQSVAGFLRELVAGCATHDEVITRLRGAQVAFFLADCLLLVNELQIAARAEQAPSALTDEDIKVLREEQAARISSLAVLAALSGHGGAALSRVRLADVAADGGTATIAGQAIQVPDLARPILRAQRIWLRMAGAQGDDAFLGATAGHHPDEKKLQDTLSQLTAETGLRLAGRYTRHVNESEQRWLRRYGVSVQFLQQEARNPEGVGLR